MLLDKKFKLILVFFIISLLSNLVLAYVLFDNAISASYLEMDIARCQRQKSDSIKYLNLTLEKNKNFNFSEITKTFINQNDLLFKPNEDGYTVLGNLCFKKTNGIYKALYCENVNNPIDKRY